MTEPILSPYQTHYRKDPAKHKARAKKRTIIMRQQTRDHLDKIRSETPCARCGVRYPLKPWYMAFDHLPGTDKVANVADSIKLGWGRAKIDAEIDKCQVLCLLCHADVTRERRLNQPKAKKIARRIIPLP